jgi:hypothetical protein
MKRVAIGPHPTLRFAKFLRPFATLLETGEGFGWDLRKRAGSTKGAGIPPRFRGGWREAPGGVSLAATLQGGL